MAFCGKCFNQYPGGVCPYCGYDPAADIAKYAVALPSGSILSGRYIVGRVLGQGGFGITYAALDYDSKKLVAIKEHFPAAIVTRAEMNTVRLMSSDMADSFLSGKEKFLAEARTLSQFNGLEQICDIYSYFEENGTAYFAMEYVEGIPLDQYIKKLGRMLSFEEALRLLLPVMKALSVVHAAGIIHRDLAPDNIIVKPYGGVMLIDFGAARYSMGEMSRSLDVILKHGFAPKEQYARRGRQGAYTDVYAIAATFYYAITGRVPPDAIERSDDDELIAPSKLGVSIPHRAEAVLLKALAVDYKSRFQSMDELIQKFSPFLPDMKKEMEARQAAERKAQAEAREAERKAAEEKRLAEKKALEEKRAAERKAEEERRAAERKAAEEKREAERKAAEEKREAERKAAEEKRRADKLAQEAKRQAELRAQEEARKAREEQKALEAARKTEAKAAKKAKADAAEKPKKKSPVALIAALAAVAIGAGAFFALSADKAQAPVIQKEEAAIETAAPAEATPAPTKEPAHIEWTLSNDGTLYISGTGPMEDYILDIKEEHTSTAPWSTKEIIDKTRKLVIQTGLTHIGDSAFYSFTSLREVVLPDTLSSIGNGAFNRCTTLSSVNLPSSLKSISGSAFAYCHALSDIKLPEGLETIGGSAFAYSALSSVELPSTLKSVGGNAFAFCHYLRHVKFSEGIETVDNKAFSDCRVLKSVELPSTLKSIDYSSFSHCDSLTAIVLPEGVESIGNSSFSDCSSLSRIELPSTLESIGIGAFTGCNALRDVVYTGGSEQWDRINIGNYNAPLLNANIEFTAIAAGEAGDNITWNLTKDGTMTFRGEGYMNNYVLVENNVATYNTAPWSSEQIRSRVKNVVISPDIVSVGDYAFVGCSGIKEISLPEGLVRIGSGTFQNCSALHTINLPETAEQVGPNAFKDCRTLSTVNFDGSEQQWNAIGIDIGNECLTNASIEFAAIAAGEAGENISWLLDKNGTLTISGSGPMDAYIVVDKAYHRTTAPWCAEEFGSAVRKVELSPGITSVGNYAFKFCDNLYEISLPDSITRVGPSAFDGCDALRVVNFDGTEEQWNGVIIDAFNDPLNNAKIHFAQ